MDPEDIMNLALELDRKRRGSPSASNSIPEVSTAQAPTPDEPVSEEQAIAQQLRRHVRPTLGADVAARPGRFEREAGGDELAGARGRGLDQMVKRKTYEPQGPRDYAADMTSFIPATDEYTSAQSEQGGLDLSLPPGISAISGALPFMAPLYTGVSVARQLSDGTPDPAIYDPDPDLPEQVRNRQFADRVGEAASRGTAVVRTDKEDRGTPEAAITAAAPKVLAGVHGLGDLGFGVPNLLTHGALNAGEYVGIVPEGRSGDVLRNVDENPMARLAGAAVGLPFAAGAAPGMLSSIPMLGSSLGAMPAAQRGGGLLKPVGEAMGRGALVGTAETAADLGVDSALHSAAGVETPYSQEDVPGMLLSGGLFGGALSGVGGAVRGARNLNRSQNDVSSYALNAIEAGGENAGKPSPRVSAAMESTRGLPRTVEQELAGQAAPSFAAAASGERSGNLMRALEDNADAVQAEILKLPPDLRKLAMAYVDESIDPTRVFNEQRAATVRKAIPGVVGVLDEARKQELYRMFPEAGQFEQVMQMAGGDPQRALNMVYADAALPVLESRGAQHKGVLARAHERVAGLDETQDPTGPLLAALESIDVADRTVAASKGAASDVLKKRGEWVPFDEVGDRDVISTRDLPDEPSAILGADGRPVVITGRKEALVVRQPDEAFVGAPLSAEQYERDLRSIKGRVGDRFAPGQASDKALTRAYREGRGPELSAAQKLSADELAQSEDRSIAVGLQPNLNRIDTGLANQLGVESGIRGAVGSPGSLRHRVASEAVSEDPRAAEAFTSAERFTQASEAKTSPELSYFTGDQPLLQSIDPSDPTVRSRVERKLRDYPRTETEDTTARDLVTSRFKGTPAMSSFDEMGNIAKREQSTMDVAKRAKGLAGEKPSVEEDDFASALGITPGKQVSDTRDLDDVTRTLERYAAGGLGDQQAAALEANAAKYGLVDDLRALKAGYGFQQLSSITDKNMQPGLVAGRLYRAWQLARVKGDEPMRKAQEGLRAGAYTSGAAARALEEDE